MALDTIPPWLNPPNFLGAMERGAQLGLEQRREDLLQAQTADRLKFAYEQLGSRERIAAKAVQARQLQAQAALALRQNFLDLAVRNATERERHNKAMESGRTSPMGDLQKFDVADTKKKLGKVTEDLRNDLAWQALGAAYDPKSGAYRSAVADFNLKQRTAELLRSKLRGIGKGGSSVTHTYNPETGALSPVAGSGSAAGDLIGLDTQDEED